MTIEPRCAFCDPRNPSGCRHLIKARFGDVFICADCARLGLHLVGIDVAPDAVSDTEARGRLLELRP